MDNDKTMKMALAIAVMEFITSIKPDDGDGSKEKIEKVDAALDQFINFLGLFGYTIVKTADTD